MTNSPLVSVVVPSYNSRGTIAPCLDSLLSQDAGTGYEIIVVDSSADGTADLVRHSYPAVPLVHEARRLLPGAARNLGAGRARGEILAFIDSDCVADRGWLRSVVGAMRLGYRMVGGAVANLSRQSRIGTADYLLTFNEFSPGMPRREVTYLPSANLACTSELFHEIGGFPGDLPAGEDQLFTRAASRKTRVLFDPGAVVYHRNREDLRRFILHHYAFGSNASRVRKRNALPGDLLARVPFLSPLAPLARAARIGGRVLFRNRELLPQLAFSFPWALVGIGSWGCGFIRAAFARDPAPVSDLPGLRYGTSSFPGSGSPAGGRQEGH